MVTLEDSWKSRLKSEFKKDYFLSLAKFVNREYETKTIYPPKERMFEALNLTEFDKVKVVIIGQDPYINEGQAHGLCFSIEKGALPPSLVNIFSELKNELGCYIPNNGNLTKWAKQGVLLLNSVLTVQKGKSLSHKNMGWEIFTREIIKKLAYEREHLVFMLWGNWAKNVVSGIDLSKHYVLKCAHPSPLSAYNGFFGCNHFKKCNEILTSLNLAPIDWQIENK